MPSISALNSTHFKCLKPIEKLFQNEKVQKIALETFSELTLSLSVIGLMQATAFVTVGAPILIASVVVQSVISTWIRVQREKTPTESYSWAAALPSGYSAMHAQLLLHEAGHALAAKLLYHGACPKIFYYGIASWITEHIASRPTLLGKCMSKPFRTTLIAFSGPFVSLSISAAILALGLKLKEDHPQWSKHLIIAALLNIVFHALYAFSALSPVNYKGNDFMKLGAYGLHPLIAAVMILAIPLLVYQKVS